MNCQQISYQFKELELTDFHHKYTRKMFLEISNENSETWSKIPYKSFRDLKDIIIV